MGNGDKNMNKFYITGVSGTGKSTLVEELCKRGVRALDIDEIDNLCHWKNKISGEKAQYQYGIGKDWLEAHDYTCEVVELKKLLDTQRNTSVIIAGVASNQDEYLNLFNKVFLLHCQEETFLHRLNARDNNEFAKEKSEQEHVLSWYKEFEDKMRKKGAIPISTEGSISGVADQIMSYINLEK